mmetsp:Transcript_10155/g.17704  ORF Transcript_10155/g.17704 Transcript_10155/m.17704 type:complete len:201 (-) Transcript_10155:385-987(-)
MFKFEFRNDEASFLGDTDCCGKSDLSKANCLCQDIYSFSDQRNPFVRCRARDHDKQSIRRCSFGKEREIRSQRADYFDLTMRPFSILSYKSSSTNSILAIFRNSAISSSAEARSARAKVLSSVSSKLRTITSNALITSSASTTSSRSWKSERIMFMSLLIAARFLASSSTRGHFSLLMAERISPMLSAKQGTMHLSCRRK